MIEGRRETPDAMSRMHDSLSGRDESEIKRTVLGLETKIPPS